MAAQVRVAAETFPTLPAGERLLAAVDFFMAEDVGFFAETFSAFVAHEGFLPAVNSLVPAQV